ncbi:MAG: 30S ribosomal protein S6 [bacterium]
MQLYEFVVVISGKLEEEKVDGILTEIENIIKEHQGEIVKTDKWGKKKLDYEIQSESDGYYVLLHLKANKVILNELEKFCKVTECILRQIILKLKKEIELVSK